MNRKLLSRDDVDALFGLTTAARQRYLDAARAANTPPASLLPPPDFDKLVLVGGAFPQFAMARNASESRTV